MKKTTKSKGASVKVDPYLEGLMAKLLERLLSLEKKVDTVIAQTVARSAAPAAASGSPKPPSPEPPQSSRRDRMMYEAICADCAKVCEVPFKPAEGRAVYCKDCFAKRKSGGQQAKIGMPTLTPVALPPKPVSAQPAPAAAAPAPTPKKASKPAKKAKKKK